jgi:hypothetical protein
MTGAGPCTECNGSGYAGGVARIDRTPDPCPKGCRPVVLAAPVYIGLFQAAPASWTVEINICGALRYVKGENETRRAALGAVLKWIEEETAVSA